MHPRMSENNRTPVSVSKEADSAGKRPKKGLSKKSSKKNLQRKTSKRAISDSKASSRATIKGAESLRSGASKGKSQITLKRKKSRKSNFSPAKESVKDDSDAYWARAAYDFKTDTAGDLPFSEGDLIEIVDMTDRDWWKGKLNCKIGSFQRI